MASIQQSLTALINPVAVSLGCELWGLEFVAQGRQSLLRIYIDKDDGVTLEDCERVSRQVSSVLDVEDLIKGEYTLEVSSPGMDRPLFSLAQFEQSIGERVQIKLRMPFDGRRKFTGVLIAVENEEVILQVDNDEFVLPIETIEKANIIPQF